MAKEPQIVFSLHTGRIEPFIAQVFNELGEDSLVEGYHRCSLPVSMWRRVAPGKWTNAATLLFGNITTEARVNITYIGIGDGQTIFYPASTRYTLEPDKLTFLQLKAGEFAFTHDYDDVEAGRLLLGKPTS